MPPDTTGVQPANAASRPRVAFAQGSFINATTIETSGIDFGVRASFPITDKIKFTTSGEATYIFYLNTEFPDGHTEHYAGTLGNFNLTAGFGHPAVEGELAEHRRCRAVLAHRDRLLHQRL